MVEFRQGFRSMSAPTRELEKLIVSRRFAHGANPVTRWMAANVASPRTTRASSSPRGTSRPTAMMASSR
jgi:phage terminase large subunit-like protein